MKPGAIYVNSARAAAARHRRARRRAAVGPPRRRRPRPLRGRAPRRPTIRCARCTNVVLTPHIGGATYDTEANHSKLIADDVARILARRQAGQLRQPGGARVMAESKGTAEEIKAELLWVAQEMLRHGPRARHRGQLLGAPPRRQRRAHAVVARVRDDDARRSRRLRPRRQRASRATRGPTTEKMLHLACLKAYDDIHAVIHCHAKYCTMFALTHQPIPCVIEEVEVFVGGDVPVANYKFTGSDELGRRGVEVGRRPRRGADGQPRPAHRGQAPEGRAQDREPRRAHRARSCGAPARSASSSRSPSDAKKMAPIYKIPAACRRAETRAATSRRRRRYAA